MKNPAASKKPVAPALHLVTNAAPKAAPRKRAAEVAPSNGVVAQVRSAFGPKNRLPAVLGFLLASLVPVAVFAVAHREVDWSAAPWSQPKVALVLGGLLFSAKTVYRWACLAFDDKAKAAGFVVLLEGVMVGSSNAWLSGACLFYLVAINGLATAHQLTK